MLIKSKKGWDRELKPKSQKKLKKKQVRLQERGNKLRFRNELYCLQLKHKVTEAEIQFGYILCELNLPFSFQKGFLTPFHRIVDFYIPSLKMIIEIDGAYHNNIKSKDEYKDKVFLEKRNIRTIRILNEEIPQLQSKQLGEWIEIGR